jgi:hypothetical protein
VPDPPSDFRGALTGITTTAIDTDPDTMVQVSIGSLLANGQRVLAVIPFLTFQRRMGYLVISQDPATIAPPKVVSVP